ncbi:EAL domain-containing protein [Rhizobium sp. S-51]|uniref:EAL domain-containing protein n=2 Tax=Rhizobium terricola TaxID=2728849 RepID=A0A7Y0ATI2_9HYPH|nr:EAL domain-containing protein [Rhizobium terricola]
MKTSLSRPFDMLRSAGVAFLRLGEAGQTEFEAGRIRAVRLAAVLRNTPWMMAANLANAAVAIVALVDNPMHVWVLVWAAMVTAIALLTGLRWWQNRDRPERETASLRGTRRAVVFAVVTSGLWACLSALFYYYATEHQRLVIIAITVGMTGGGGFALATVPPAAIAFSAIMGIGSAFAIAEAGELIGMNLFALYVVYAAIIIRSSFALCDSLTIRVRAQLAADEQRDVIGLLLNDFEENAADWLWGLDRNLLLRRASPRFFEEVATGEDKVYGRPLWEVMPFMDNGRRFLTDVHGSDELRRILHDHAPFRDFEICVVRDGELGVWSLSAKPVFDGNGAFVGFRGVGRDVTQAREARGRIEYMARHDSLTDVGNRVLLNEDLGRALSRLERFNEGFAVLLLDLDRFKQVNDTHGHGAGDELLREVATTLKALCGEGDTIARLGGDEFAIIRAVRDDPRAAAELADRVVNALSQPFVLASGTARIGVSVGIACAPIDGRNADTLIRHADLALYRAKGDGRNRYRFFDTSLDAAARRRNALEQELRAAVAADALSLHFQPLVDSRSGEIVCAEALLRWNHPSLGSVSPAEFIPIAEDIGLIGRIGTWVIRKGCETATAWPETVRLAVNLSPRQFGTPGLFTMIESTLRECGLPPRRLELEVTESLLLNSDSAVESTLAAIKGLGVRIALDDFGTGYSSLSYLRRYRFDKLKIDQSFISDIETNADSRAIVDAVIRLGRDLGVSLAAEGVETSGQYELLRRLGCGEIQGYLVGKPMPAAELERLMDSHQAWDDDRITA